MMVRKLASLPVLAALLLACSGAGNEDLFAARGGPTQNDTATSPPTPSNGGTSQSSDPTQPTGGGSGSGSASAAPSESSDPPPPPPPPAAPACPQESEPNDTLKTATLFTSSICGAIATRDDVDFVKVVAPDHAKRMTYTVKSKDDAVAYHLYANGLPIPFDPGELPVSGGSTYALELRSAGNGGGAKPTWEVDVTFE